MLQLATGDNDRVREAAARALTAVVKRQTAREFLVNNGLQAVLPPLITSPAPAVSRAGLGLLHAVCSVDLGAVNVLAESVARPVLNALNSSGEGVALAAATALCVLAKSPRAVEVRRELLPVWVGVAYCFEGCVCCVCSCLCVLRSCVCASSTSFAHASLCQ